MRELVSLLIRTERLLGIALTSPSCSFSAYHYEPLNRLHTDLATHVAWLKDHRKGASGPQQAGSKAALQKRRAEKARV